MLKVVGRWGRLSFDPFFSFENKNYGDWFCEMHMFHAFALPILPLGICIRGAFGNWVPSFAHAYGAPNSQPNN